MSGKTELDPETVTSVEEVKTIPPGMNRARASILSEYNSKRTWMAIAAVLAVTNIVSPVVLTMLLTKDQLVIAIDGTKTFHIGPGKELESSEEIMSTHALLASMALLQRSAAGFDLPEILKQLFNTACGDRARKELEGTLPDIKTRNERWRPEVSKVELVKMDADNLFAIRAAGQLVKTGIAAGAPFESVQNYTLILRMIKNPRLTQNSRYPLVVYDYDLRLEAPAGGPGTKPASLDKGESARRDLLNRVQQGGVQQ